MCCLFGMIDLNQNFTGRQKSNLLHILATACEVRGTDATGIAYSAGGRIQVYKRPVAGHRLRLRIPNGTVAVMGHTRMTTQGCESRNYNNHPFRGQINGHTFALAHNGVLRNDKQLRIQEHLPATNIETDSFVAVQLIQKKETLNLNSLTYMAEQVEGSFAFTVLDAKNTLYFVKGDNPLCIYYYPRSGLYLYASTEDILRTALRQMRLVLETPTKVNLDCGDILQISANGKRQMGNFNADKLLHQPRTWWHNRWPGCFHFEEPTKKIDTQKEYVRELKAVAGYYGYTPRTIDAMLEDGFTPDDIESMLYAGEL